MASRFDIVSIRNPVVKELFHLRKRRRIRADRGLTFVRGQQLIKSMGEYFQFKNVYTWEEPKACSAYNAEKIVRVEKDVLKHVIFGPSRQHHAERLGLHDIDLVVGTIEPPAAVDNFEKPSRLLAVDGVRQPENMGLLLSTAVAMQFDGVVFSDDCIDPFNYKVLEASQAVAWPMPFRWASAADLLALCESHGLTPFAADTQAAPVTDLPIGAIAEKGFCLAIGSEASGVRAELREGCRQVALPMSELVDSLNAGVAGGILMHALTCAWRR
eukprot:TRINITY_DN22314_c0_g1_i1.p1 TRINITY_DN22314_c0_g1~~TRINITY_DN22314_c0_g1_i1.p1  ORF type:complete len:271 (+),score=49.11 TRINITY_DN22314_c0_g1_i1:113-925(+)